MGGTQWQRLGRGRVWITMGGEGSHMLRGGLVESGAWRPRPQAPELGFHFGGNRAPWRFWMEEFGYFGAVWCRSVDGRGLGASQQVTAVHCREGSVGWVG